MSNLTGQVTRVPCARRLEQLGTRRTTLPFLRLVEQQRDRSRSFVVEILIRRGKNL